MKNKPKKHVLATALMFGIVSVSTYFLCDQYVITTPQYTIKSDKIKNGFKIALISDLHNMDFGNDNKPILDVIERQSPDIIAVVGDMIDERSDDITPALNLMKNLPDIAPTYYVLGNHDKSCWRYETFKKEIMNAKVHFLRTTDNGTDIISKSEITTTLNGDKVHILGLHTYSNGEYEDPRYTQIMDKFCSKDGFKILLCHYPEFSTWFFEQDKYYETNFDLILCGHTHGGLVRIPFVGGLIAPNQGYFPEYDRGIFRVAKQNKNPYHMVITGGLGQDRRCIRINNFPQVTIVNVVSKT